jgi:hypothetical protein
MWDGEQEVETSDVRKDAAVRHYSDESLNSQHEN